MAFLTKKQFAESIAKPTNWLSIYIGRSQVVLGADDLIDTLHEKNVSFLQKWKPQSPVASTSGLGKPPPVASNSDKLSEIETKENIITIDLNNIPSYDISERLLKYLDTQKREHEIERLRLDIEKKRGEVVPVDPIGQLIFSFKQFVLTQQKLTYEKFLAEISHKYSIKRDDMAYYRGFFIKALNDAIVEASVSFDKELGSVLSEFTVKRGVGERGE